MYIYGGPPAKKTYPYPKAPHRRRRVRLDNRHTGGRFAPTRTPSYLSIVMPACDVELGASHQAPHHTDIHCLLLALCKHNHYLLTAPSPTMIRILIKLYAFGRG